MKSPDIPDRQNSESMTMSSGVAHDPIVSRRTVLGMLGSVCALAAGIFSHQCDTAMQAEAKKYGEYAKGNMKKTLEYWELAQSEQEDMSKKAQYIELIRTELKLYRTNTAYASNPHQYAVQQTLPNMDALSDRELLEGTDISLDDFQRIADVIVEKRKRVSAKLPDASVVTQWTEESNMRFEGN